MTSIFPLGGPVEAPVSVELKGWNLAATDLAKEAKPPVIPPSGDVTDADPDRANAERQTVIRQEVTFAEPGIYQISAGNGQRLSNPAPFAVDTLSECLELEPINTPETAQRAAEALARASGLAESGSAIARRVQLADHVAYSVFRRYNSGDAQSPAPFFTLYHCTCFRPLDSRRAEHFFPGARVGALAESCHASSIWPQGTIKRSERRCLSVWFAKGIAVP